MTLASPWPVARASPSRTPSCLSDFTYTTDGLTANFQDTTPGGASQWLWVFEGPEASAAQNPSYTFASAGTYPVTLDAMVGGVSCTQQVRDVTVADPLPTPAPSASPTPTPAPTATPDPLCTVPGLAGQKRRDAQDLWNAAGFSTIVQLVPGASETANWTIQYQSLNSGNAVTCNVTIQIGPDPLPTAAP